MVADRADADDVIQNVYTNAYTALRRSSARPTDGRAWLFTLTYHCCVDEIRRRGRVRALVNRLSSSRTIRSVAQDGENAAHAVTEAMRSLPAPSRAVIMLVDAFGYGYDEVGEILGIPPGTVASRLSRARQTVRQAVGEVTEEQED